MRVHRRIGGVLTGLGIERAHFASALATELLPLIEPGGVVASLTLVNPNRLESDRLAPLGHRLQIITGSEGLPAAVVGQAAHALPQAEVRRIDGYYTAAWSDLAADEPGMVCDRLLRHASTPRLARWEPGSRPPQGEIDGVSYRVRGAGPPLVLMPLLLAPSQWEPVVGELSRSFSVVVLGGRHLGMVAMLESRGAEPGYQRVLASVFDELAPSPGESILEIGCGTGVLARWIARRTRQRCPIVATDLNPYFLREASDLAASAGLSDTIGFHEADAEALPFDDGEFDVVFSSTVMEECDAERMLAEMIRVARPGGRVAVVVRATDMQNVCTVPVADPIRMKVAQPYPSVAERGCADASLYQRFARSPLVRCRSFPHLLTLTDAEGAAWAYREPYILSLLSGDEVGLWQEAKRRSVQDGTFVFSSGLHCAVGEKPG